MAVSGALTARFVDRYRDRALPEPAWPVGYANLIDRYDLVVPLPPRLTAIYPRYRGSKHAFWQLLSSRTAFNDTLGGHLRLALKWEGVDLGVLAALFDVLAEEDLVAVIRAQPTSTYGRRVWFLYEWLTGNRLPIPDLGATRITPLLDRGAQYALPGGELSSRHKVIDNLPGTPAFCPLVRRSPSLSAFDLESLKEEVRRELRRTHPDLIRRAAAFLELSDSRASFQIEGESPPASRIARWGEAIGRAGRVRLTRPELERLQRVLIHDDRFVKPGLRDEDGFIGLHDRLTRAPIPDHIDARAEDLPTLVEGVVAYVDRSLRGGLDPIVTAAAAAFGLVYIHPFEDGNGRIHRWLLHHVLSAGGATPSELVFPMSSVILRRIAEYRDVLESYSRPLLHFVEWEETPDHSIRVTNETARFYRYFDATAHAEFLYSCVEEAVRRDIPDEVLYLRRRDDFSDLLREILDLPARLESLLVSFLEQNGGVLSKRARTREFAELRPDEVERIEALYAEVFRAGPEHDHGLEEVEDEVEDEDEEHSE